MRVLALLLTVAAIGSAVISVASHNQRYDTTWSTYTPLSNQADDHDGVTPIDQADESLGVSTPEIQPTATYDEYDSLAWDDARLWLGLAIGFAVSAAAVGVTCLRRRA